MRITLNRVLNCSVLALMLLIPPVHSDTKKSGRAAFQAADLEHSWKIPSSQLPRVRDTPDIMQTTPALNLPASGFYYCAPVALANAFIFLSKQGYKNLA